MGDIKLFKLNGNNAEELAGKSVSVEKSLQTIIERNLETFLGVRFLASEYSTGKRHAGRIDTLGIDENHSPVIIEYKRSVNENVINQGLFYLDWLLDHKAEFELMTLRKYGEAVADAIDWSSPVYFVLQAVLQNMMNTPYNKLTVTLNFININIIPMDYCY
jgi:hypothetical protein